MRAFVIGMLGMGLAAGSQAEEKISLAEPMHVGMQVKVRLHLVLRGEIQVDKKDEKVAGQALLVYPERILAVNPNGYPKTIARFYDDARAKFVIGHTEDPRQLRPDLRLAIGNIADNGVTLWSPSGPYNSDEIELIEDVIDTSQLTGLLPQSEVAVGEKWDPPADVQKRLCDLEEFITSTIECSLKEANEEQATINITGKIHGLTYGSEVKSNVDGTLTFDRPSNMITKLEWKQIDSRAASPVSPAGAYEVTIAIEREPGESPMLSDSALANIDSAGSDARQLLVFEDPSKRFRFLHDRNWHVTLLEGDRAILRRLDGRTMVAQLNIHVLGENNNIAELSAEQLQAMIIQSGELKIDEIVRSESLPTEGARQIRLVRAKGSRGNVELVQRHYIAQDASGRQILLSFLTEPDNEEKLGEADLALVQSIEFPSGTASKSTDGPR